MSSDEIIAPGFTGHGLDRADNLRHSAERISELAARADARLMHLDGLDPKLSEDGRILWSRISDHAGIADLIFLGLTQDTPLFAPLPRLDPEAVTARGRMNMIGLMAGEDVAIWGTARSLVAWHNRHGFCSNCGVATVPFRAGWGRSCPGCQAEHFPRVDPVVIMLAEHEGKVLVGRQARFAPRFYSALAGFVEPGESIEEAVARELFEEAGVRASRIRYVASQPWPFPGALMIACLADAASDAVVLDTTELEDSMWVDRAGVAAALAGDPSAPFLAPPRFAIANTLLDRWLRRI